MKVSYEATRRRHRFKMFLALGILTLALGGAISCGSSQNAPVQSSVPPVQGPVGDFQLPAVGGKQVALSDYLGQKPVLLFYSMGVGCDPCLQQIADLEKDAGFQASNVQLLNVAIDSVPVLTPAVEKFGIKTPMLSDEQRRTCATFGVNCQSMGGRPGHVFVLVDKDRKVRWFKDYGGVMYVEPKEIDAQVTKALQNQ